METQSIINVVTAIFNGSDERNWNKVESSFAEQVVLDYSSMAGGKPNILTPKEIISAWKTLLPGFQSTHHQVGSFQVNIAGNTATAFNNGLALHYLPNETGNDVWVVVGTYDFGLSKNSKGEWKVNSMKFNLQKQEGNLQLPSLAQRKVKENAVFKASPLSENNKAVIEKFFTSLEKLDIPAFLETWAEDGKQYMPLSPDNFPKELIGKDAIYNQYKGLPENYTSMKLARQYFATNDANTVIVQYGGIIPLKDGGEYNNNYVGIFKVNNGKVEQFTQYFDPFILKEAFGKKLENNFNVKGNEASEKKIQFKSEGLVLTGILHLPKNFKETIQYKGVVVTGSWTTVKEQMPDLYATKLAEQGVVAFTFDFRNYGESEGQPRNYEVPDMKAQDIINAIIYLKSLQFIDKNEIAGLAVCASSGYMVEAIAKGADVKALTLVAPWLHNHSIVREIYGGEEGVSNKIQQSNEAKKRFAETGKVEYVPAISTTDKNAAMFGEFDYYLNPKRGAIKEWGNQFAVMAWQGWLDYDPIAYASQINIPVLIIHSKTAAVPQGAEMFYKNLKSAKNIIWLDKAIQFDFYDQEPYTTNAAGEAMKWYNRYLN